MIQASVSQLIAHVSSRVFPAPALNARRSKGLQKAEVGNASELLPDPKNSLEISHGREGKAFWRYFCCTAADLKKIA